MSSKLTSTVQEQNLGIKICFYESLTSVLNGVQKNKVHAEILKETENKASLCCCINSWFDHVLKAACGSEFPQLRKDNSSGKGSMKGKKDDQRYFVLNFHVRNN